MDFGSQINSNYTRSNKTTKVYMIMVVLVIILVVVLVSMLFMHGKKSNNSVSMDSIKAIDLVKPVQKKVKEKVVSNIQLSSINLSRQDDVVKLSLFLTNWTAYRINFINDHKTLVLTLFNSKVIPFKKGTIKEAEESFYTASGLKMLGDFKEEGVEVNTFSDSDNLILNFDFKNKVFLTKSQLAKSKPSHLTLNLTSYIEPKPATKPLEKAAIPKEDETTPKDDPDAIYSAAKNLSNFGKYDEAIIQLRANPLVTFADQKSLQLLVDLYLNKKDFFMAEQVASQGAVMFEADIEIRNSWAQASFGLQDYSKALKILSAKSPNMLEYPDYYALKASAALKLEHYDLASSIYRNLLSINPNKADWWAGLGITLQGQGKNNLALESYQRAIKVSGLRPELVGFVKGQIFQLQ